MARIGAPVLRFPRGKVGRALAGLVAVTAVGTTPVLADPAAGGIEIRVLSGRADLVSGGDALVEVVVPVGVSPAAVHVAVGGRDVTSAFAQRPNGKFEGLVTGLGDGLNVLAATVPGGAGATLNIVNHPIGGPVFAGPQVQPWVCQSTAVDRQCNQPIQFSYLYRSTNPKAADLQPYDPAHPASDVAMTTTDQGVTVPFIIRLETGYADRDQYKIATLFQPGKPWAPWAAQPQWNHKLLITHGASCGLSYGSGGAPSVVYDGSAGNTTGVPIVDNTYAHSPMTALGLGFAVMSTALDNNGHNCNIATQAESLVMAKERMVEGYGQIRYTIGTGCSGGSLTQQQVANAYPGIYQGILPQCSFPDTWSSATQVADFHMLRLYFEQPSKWGTGIAWSPTQMAAVEGSEAPVNAIVSDMGFFSAIVATNACNGTTNQNRYNPQTNPGGVRCSIADYMAWVLGVRQPKDWGPQEKQLGHGFGGVPVDNVGVQYGLSALREGLITPAQFVDLNVKIGGLDIDANPIAGRFAANEPALANAYRTGAINEATNLGQVAIIDLRGPDPGIAHDSYRSFAVRQRLLRDTGTYANDVIWEGQFPVFGDPDYPRQALLAMDSWLSAIERDHSNRSQAQKVIADKPANVHDQCNDGYGTKLLDTLCPRADVPVYGTPRTVAGDAITTDKNKCQLKPLNRSDYGLLPLTAGQLDQLKTVFPTGVCDYSKTGVDQQPNIPWITYAYERGGRPMGAPPTSVAYGATPTRGLPDTATGPGLAGLVIVVGAAFLARAALRRRRT